MVTSRVASTFLITLLTVVAFSCSEAGKPDEADETGSVTASDTASATPMDVTDAVSQRIVLKYTPNEVYRYRITQHTKMKQDTIESTNSSSYVYSKRVHSVLAGGTFDVSMTIDSVTVSAAVRSISSSATLMSQSFNSADTSQRKDPRFANMSAPIGVPVKLVIDTNGKISKVSGIDSVTSRIIAMMPTTQNITGEMRQMLTKQIEQQVYGSFVGHEFLPYPEKALDSTLTWKRQQRSPQGPAFEISYEATYKIESIKNVKGRRLATISAQISGTINPTTPPGGMPVKIDMSDSKITGTGRYVIDLDRGVTISKKNTVRMLVVGNGTDVQTGKKESFKQEQETTFNVELLP